MAWNQIGIQYTMMKKLPPRQNANQITEATERLETMRNGTVALSPAFHSM
jgi:hypothetical protein